MVSLIFNTGESDYELKARYNYEGSDLRKAQLRMLEMLIFLDEICKANNIEYFISYGTLLGAKRHGGFIPWDDDLDVIISPKGLKKLRRIINNGKYKYIVQDFSTDKGFVRHYNVLRDINSEYVKDEYIHNQRKYRGVQVDIFPYGYGVYDFGRRIISHLTFINEKYLLGRHPFFSKLLFYLNRWLVIPFFKLLSIFKKDKYIYLGYENGWQIKYLKDDIFPLKEISFEKYFFPCPNNIDHVLITDYGDEYNNLPSVNDRNHHEVSTIKYYD